MLRKTIGGLSALGLVVVAFAGCGQSGEAATKGMAAGDSSARGAAAGDPEGDPKGGRGGGRGATPLILGPTDVADVKRGTIEEATAIQGELKPLEQIDVRARIEGNLDAVSVRAGDRVTRGQVLARFESQIEEAARKSAVADVESAKADLENAKWNAEQSAELFKAGAIPERDLRTAQQDQVASQARLAAAQSRLDAASRDAQDTRVLAPTTGVVSVRSADPGEHVTRGAVMFTVVRNDVLELEASVPARYAGDVAPQMPVKFNAADRDLVGKVARVSPTINPANRSITVYLQLPNPGGALKGNTFATGRIISRTVDGTIVVPTAAIRYAQTQQEPFVYRLVNETVEYAPVKVGIVDETNGIVQITDGLAEGDRIIVGNVGAIGRGTKVTLATTEQPQRGRPVPRP